MQYIKAKHFVALLLASALPTSLGSLVDGVFANPNIPFLETTPQFGRTRASNKLAKRAVTLNTVSYTITLDGRGQGNWEEFLVSGDMIATDGIPSSETTNGPNAADIFISVGSPVVNPIAGSIRYFSNRGLYTLAGGAYAASILDFATVTVSGATTTFVVDSNLAAANQLSQFNARSGILANVYTIGGGTISLTVTPEGVLSGFVDIVGIGSVGTVPYKAVVSGQAVAKGVLNI